MKNTTLHNIACLELANPSLSLLVSQAVGPRILSLRYQGGENLLAEIPNFTMEVPAGTFHFYGGHRLWRAPEDLHTTYVPDNAPVEVTPVSNGVRVVQQEPATGLQKAMQIVLDETYPVVEITHTLTNLSDAPMTLANWAITQLNPGGVAILPHATDATGVLPNRQIALWPYTDLRSPYLTLGNQYTFVHAQMTEGALKIGFPNPHRWLAYWQAGTLFVKWAAFNPDESYFDFGSSSECYCGALFLELETLAPIRTLVPGEAASHVETWEVFGGVEKPEDEASVARLVKRLGL